MADGVRPTVGSTDGDRQQLAHLLPKGALGWYFHFATGNAHMYGGARRLTYEWV